jgi:hypothetical protein
MKHLILFFASILFCSFGFGQITITVDDLMDVGDSVDLARVDPIPVGFNPGPAGPNQHWDFSNLVMDTFSTLNFVDPASTTYGASFPFSNIATEGLVEGFGAEGFAYATRNASLFQIDGFAGSYDIIEDLVVPFDPPEVILDFPVNYQDSLIQSTLMDIKIVSPQPGADSIRVKVVTNVESRVDAWGELSTPSWVGDVLRIREVRETIDSAWAKIFFFWVYLESNTNEQITYRYLANDIGYQVMQFNSNLDSTEYTMMSYVYDAGVGTRELSSVDEISLQIYPNPAQDVIHLIIQDLEAKGELAIYSMLGKQLYSSSVIAHQKNIDINVSAYPAGVYQMVLRTDNNALATKKFVVR